MSAEAAPGIVQESEGDLRAAIRDVVEQHVAAADGGQQENVDLVFDSPALVARRVLEQLDAGVARIDWIELAAGHALHALVGPGRSKGHALGKGLDRVDAELDEFCRRPSSHEHGR